MNQLSQQTGELPTVDTISNSVTNERKKNIMFKKIDI